MGDQISIATVRLDSTNAMNLRAKVAFNNFIGEVQIKGITVSPHKKATTAQMIKTTDDVEFGFSQLQTISFTVGDKVYSNVAFTDRDSRLTLVSYLKNPECFNLWYNDGKNVIIGVNSNVIEYTPAIAQSTAVPIVAQVTDAGKTIKYEFLTSNSLSGAFVEEISVLIDNTTSAQEKTSVIYNSLMQPIRKMQSSYFAANVTSILTDYTYDNYGNLTEEKTYDANDTAKTITATYTYDTNGNMATSTQYRGNQTLTTTHAYDSEGVLTAITAPNGQTYNYGYDGAKQKLTSYSSTLNGTAHTNGISYQNGETSMLSHNTANVCFSNNYLTDTSVIAVTPNGVFANDARLKITTTTNALDNANGYYVDKAYSNGYTERRIYDKYGHLVTLRIKEPTEQDFVKATVFIYSDKPLSEVQTDQNPLVSPFDERLNVSKNSKLIKILDYSSFSSYNNSTADGKCTVNQLTYDSVGNLQGVTFANQNNLQLGATVKDSYDRATQSNVVCNGKNIVNKVISFKNFASNEIAIERVEVLKAEDNTLYGSLTTGYSQDGLKRPLKTTVVNDSGKGYSTTYEYYNQLDENDNIVGTTPFIKSVTNKTVTNGVESSPQVALVEYDNAGNITKYGENEYVYDGLNRLITEHNADLDRSYEYTYDFGGNITAKIEYEYKNVSQSGFNNQTTFTYNDALWKDKLTKLNGTNLSYDANGNITSFNGKNLAWSAYNKLSAITMGSHQVSFSYNANGTRYQKTTVNGTTTYYYANDKLISEKTGNNTIIHYLYNSTGIIGFAYKSNNQEAIYTYRKNLFGDIIGIYDANNTCVASYAYDAYGKCSILSATNTTIANANPFRYRGYYYDVETGLYYCNARYYSPELCRWISPDSTDYLDPESIHGLNLYAYCKNNPIMYVDPSGNLGIFAKLIGIIVVLVAIYLLEKAIEEKVAPKIKKGIQIVDSTIKEVKIKVKDFFYKEKNTEEEVLDKKETNIIIHNSGLAPGELQVSPERNSSVDTRDIMNMAMAFYNFGGGPKVRYIFKGDWIYEALMNPVW